MNRLTIGHLQVLVAQARLHFMTDALICAGGAPRDILNGAPVRDIDLFVQMAAEDYGFSDDTDASAFEGRCRAFGRTLRALPMMVAMAKMAGSNEEYANLSDLCDLEVTAGPLTGYTVQVIGLTRDPIDDVHTYDFGLSQVFVTPGGWFATERYLSDRRAGSITYNGSIARNAASMLRSAKRLKRLRAKYPSWHFIGVEAHDKLLAEQAALNAEVDQIAKEAFE
jgi:hypothetical protein